MVSPLLLTGCGKSPSVSGSNDSITIKIGSAAPLTGSQAHLGKDNESGARLAVDDANTQNIVIGGNFQSCRYGINVQSGSVTNVYGVGFQNDIFSSGNYKHAMFEL